MSFNFSQNTDGTFKLVASPGPSSTTGGTIEFATGIDVEVGRGTVDTDRTYIALRNSTGVKTYIYVDTTTVVASTTKP